MNTVLQNKNILHHFVLLRIVNLLCKAQLTLQIFITEKQDSNTCTSWNSSFFIFYVKTGPSQ